MQLLEDPLEIMPGFVWTFAQDQDDAHPPAAAVELLYDPPIRGAYLCLTVRTLGLHRSSILGL